MRSEIEAKLRNILKENIENKEIVDNLKVNDGLEVLGVNSILFIKIVVSIEAVFDFEFEDEDLDYSKFRSLETLIDYIESRISNNLSVK